MSGEAAEERRFQISVLDMETADYTLVDTDAYFLGHVEDDAVTVRTMEVASTGAMTLMIALKELLREGLRAQLMREAPATLDRDTLEAMFDEVFAATVLQVMNEPIDFQDGEKED